MLRKRTCPPVQRGSLPLGWATRPVAQQGEGTRLPVEQEDMSCPEAEGIVLCSAGGRFFEPS